MTLAAVLLALSSSAAGEETTNEPYRVLRTRNAETLQRDLRRVAAEGYRVLGASMGATVVGQPRIVVLLRHDPEALYEYAVFAPSGNLEESASTEAMNALGASGYRLSSGNLLAQRVEDFWLPETAYEAQLTLILERSASPRRFTYETVRFSDFEAFQLRLATHRSEGYQVLALANSARRMRAVLGKHLDTREPTLPIDPGHYRLLLNSNKYGLTKMLKRAGKQGYRVVAATDPSINAPAMMLVEKTDPQTEPYAYRTLFRLRERHRSGKLERKINKVTSLGYRVAPSGSTPTTLVLEREPGPPRAWYYRAISSKRSPGLPAALESAVSHGHEYVTMFVDVDETVVLVEKPGEFLPDSGF